jgi:hypothetical protein
MEFLQTQWQARSDDSTWSDYPIIALSGSDLFLTFNQVRDNVSWTVGFKQSVIWQIDKTKGLRRRLTRVHALEWLGIE